MVAPAATVAERRAVPVALNGEAGTTGGTGAGGATTGSPKAGTTLAVAEFERYRPAARWQHHHQ